MPMSEMQSNEIPQIGSALQFELKLFPLHRIKNVGVSG